MTNDTPETELPTARASDAPDIDRVVNELEPSGVDYATDKKSSHHVQDSSYQNYLFGKAGAEDTPRWSSTMKGRAAIRLVSRGIVGAAFFTIGGRMARMDLEHYNPEAKPENVLQGIAWGIDKTLGAGIRKTVTAAARLKYPHDLQKAEEIGLRAVSFRPHATSQANRSYGAEVVGFTFDFAMASVGDAMTRNFAQVLDPNVKKAWLLNDEGEPAAKGEKAHIDWGKWAKSTTAATWRIFSKNQGEDWAAAIPYAFQMKFQRQFLSKVAKEHFDGHDIVFDQGWNGGAYKVNAKGQIVGDYQLAGAIDLHARFVGYNWYTLMFREAYDRIGYTFNEWKDNGFKLEAPKLPEHFNPITATIDGVANSARYITKSFIKANLYMNPAVVPFWVMRVSQSKWRGKQFVDVIEGEKPVLQPPNLEDGSTNPLYARSATNIFRNPKNLEAGEIQLNPYDPANYVHYLTDTELQRFEKRFSQGMNWMGRWQFDVGRAAGNVMAKANKPFTDRKKSTDDYNWFDKLLTFDLKNQKAHPSKMLGNGWRRFAHEYTDAAFSYTPYMYAKAETQLRVDDSKGAGEPGEMDKAIYRLMDNVAALKIGATWQSMKGIWNLGTHFEREVTMREGGEVDTKPMTTVKAGNITHGGAVPVKQTAKVDSKEDDVEKTWVETLARNGIRPDQLQSASATRH